MLMPALQSSCLVKHTLPAGCQLTQIEVDDSRQILQPPNLAQPILSHIQIFQLAPLCPMQIQSIDPVGPRADFAKAVEVFDAR